MFENAFFKYEQQAPDVAAFARGVMREVLDTRPASSDEAETIAQHISYSTRDSMKSTAFALGISEPSLIPVRYGLATARYPFTGERRRQEYHRGLYWRAIFGFDRKASSLP